MKFFSLLIGAVFGLYEAEISTFLGDVGGGGAHTNNWAVLVCASRYWFNYRHVANTLAVYRSVKRLGIPDSQVLLFLADDMACNGRNEKMGSVYNHKNKVVDLYGNDIEVDFRGEEVTVQNLIRLLTGRQDLDTPRSRRLNTNSKSNVLFYLTGHGGENFLKFQDDEEINAFELADAFEQMKQKKRYNELMFIVDTCQAQSMIRSAYSEGFVGFASSKVGEDSLSHHVDLDLGVYMVDRFTFHLLEFLEKISPNAAKKLSDMAKVCPKEQCISTPVNRFELLSAGRRQNAKVTDFFGSERKIITIKRETPKIATLGPLEKPNFDERKPIKVTMEEAIRLSSNSDNDVTLEGPSMARLFSCLILAPLLLTFLSTFK